MSQPLTHALLSYYKDIGIDVLSAETPPAKLQTAPKPSKTAENTPKIEENTQMAAPNVSTQAKKASQPSLEGDKIEGSAEYYKKAVDLAQNASDLESLQQAIQDFDGISFRNMCTNMVFSDGNPKSRVMVIGEAPGGDEDKLGKPFVGKAGQLLDRMFAAIGLDRQADDPKDSFYISNILNWRPPGNRTPTEQEIDISLPFIERHITLIKPDIIVLMGAVSGKSLLNKKEGISKFRGKWHTYAPQTKSMSEFMPETPIKALATFHPAYLLRQAEKKKESWQDLLSIKKHLEETA